MNKIRCQLCINLFLIVSSCVFALGLVEIALRAHGIEGTAPSSAARLKVYDFHSELGWWPRAARSYYRSSSYYGHFNYYNAARMPVARGSLDVLPDPDVTTIAFVGDSFVEGFYVPYEKSFVHLVDLEFNDYQVINLGVAGYNPSQYLLRARMDLPKYNVRHVIVGFFAYNDVDDVDRPYKQGYATPVFGDDLRAPLNTPLAKETGDGPEVSFFHKIARQSAAYSVIRPFYKNAIRYIKPETGNARGHDRLNPDPKEYAKALRLIAAIQDVVPEATLMVVYIPFYDHLLFPKKFAKNLELFRSNCKELQISCQVPAFIEDPVETLEPLYIGGEAGEGHFSELGSRVFAEFIIDILRKDLGESDRSARENSPKVTDSTGSL